MIEITDIIDKAFEPPFKMHNLYGQSGLCDKSGNIAMMMSRDTEAEKIILANHICDLLNREHCEEGGEGCGRVLYSRYGSSDLHSS